MKFNFKMDVKGVPNATVACEFECTNDELITLINDPVYQQVGRKLVEEISFAPKSSSSDDDFSHDDRRNDRKSSNAEHRHDRKPSQHSAEELVKRLNNRVDELLKKHHF